MKIFLGGKVFRDEFRAVERDVRIAAARHNAEVVAFEEISRRKPPFPSKFELATVDFFVLCRSFPNEFSPRDVERLRRAAPLAPIALIVGALCDGENRTGTPFPGVRRFYVGGWRESGRREFFRFLAESSGLFAAFPLETNVDRLAASPPQNRLDSPIPPISAPTPLAKSEIVLFADADPALGRFLREIFAERGATVRVESILTLKSRPEPPRPEPISPPKAEPARIIVDSVDLAAPNFRDYLRAVREKFPTAPIDVLAFSPRVDELADFENAAVWGRVSVLSKPFDVEFLLAAPENRAALR